MSLFKRKFKIGSAIVSGAALGYIALNAPGVILGAYGGYHLANNVLDKDGETKLDYKDYREYI